MQQSIQHSSTKETRFLVPALGALVLVLLWATALADLDVKRQQSLAESKRHLIETSEIVSRKIHLLFQLADVTLLDLAEHWGEGPSQLSQRLKARFDVVHGLPEEASISFYALPASPSREQLARWPNAVNEPWFKQHAEQASSSTIISPPMRDAVSAEPVVLLTRGVRNAQGRFMGVVAAAIPVARLVNLYPFLDLSDDGLFAVFRDDGVLLARASGDDITGSEALIADIAQKGLWVYRQFEPALQEQGRTFAELESPVDGIRRLQYYTTTADYPLTVAVAQSVRNALLPYQEVRSRHLIGASALSLLIVLGLTLFMLRQRDQLRAMAAQSEQLLQLQSAQQSLERSRETLRALAMRQQEMVEDERKYIAQEVHDELGQRLSILRLELAMLMDQLGPGEVQQDLARMKSQADELISAVRDVSHRLRPGALEAGLQSAIEVAIQDFSRSTGIRVAVQSTLPTNIQLPESIKVAAFRIAQEALTNIARHANATSVEMALTAADGTLVMRIKDDGVGFDPSRRSATSMGITGMSERAHAVDGHVIINAAPGRGSEVLVRMPIALTAS